MNSDREALLGICHELYAMAQGPQPIEDAVEAMVFCLQRAGFGRRKCDTPGCSNKANHIIGFDHSLCDDHLKEFVEWRNNQ